MVKYYLATKIIFAVEYYLPCIPKFKKGKIIFKAVRM